MTTSITASSDQIPYRFLSADPRSTEDRLGITMPRLKPSIIKRKVERRESIWFPLLALIGSLSIVGATMAAVDYFGAESEVFTNEDSQLDNYFYELLSVAGHQLSELHKMSVTLPDHEKNVYYLALVSISFLFLVSSLSLFHTSMEFIGEGFSSSLRGASLLKNAYRQGTDKINPYYATDLWNPSFLRIKPWISLWGSHTTVPGLNDYV